jgi:hypothetical protein
LDTKIRRSSAIESDYQETPISGSGGISTNVRARMKNLNPENDLLFLKIKETFTVKLKMIFVDHYFHPAKHQKNA